MAADADAARSHGSGGGGGVGAVAARKTKRLAVATSGSSDRRHHRADKTGRHKERGGSSKSSRRRSIAGRGAASPSSSPRSRVGGAASDDAEMPLAGSGAAATPAAPTESDSGSDDEEEEHQAALAEYNDIRERKFYEQVERRFYLEERERRAQQAAAEWVNGARRTVDEREVAREFERLTLADVLIGEAAESWEAAHCGLVGGSGDTGDTTGDTGGRSRAGDDGELAAPAQAEKFLPRSVASVADQSGAAAAGAALMIPSFRVIQSGRVTVDVREAATESFLARRAAGLLSTPPEAPLNPFLVPRAPGTKVRKGMRMRPLVLPSASASVAVSHTPPPPPSSAAGETGDDSDSRTPTPTADGSPPATPSDGVVVDIMGEDEFGSKRKRRRRATAQQPAPLATAGGFQLPAGITPQMQQLELVRQAQQEQLLSLPQLSLGADTTPEELALAQEMLLAFGNDYPLVSHLLATLRGVPAVAEVFASAVVPLGQAEKLDDDLNESGPESPVASSPVLDEDSSQAAPAASRQVEPAAATAPLESAGKPSEIMQVDSGASVEDEVPSPPVPAARTLSRRRGRPQVSDDAGEFAPLPVVRRGRKKQHERGTPGTLKDIDAAPGKAVVILDRLVSPYSRRPAGWVDNGNGNTNHSSDFVVPTRGDMVFVRVPTDTSVVPEGGVWLEGLIESVHTVPKSSRRKPFVDSRGDLSGLQFDALPGDEFEVTVSLCCDASAQTESRVRVLASTIISSLPVGSEIWKWHSGDLMKVDFSSPRMIANAIFAVSASSARRGVKPVLATQASLRKPTRRIDAGVSRVIASALASGLGAPAAPSTIPKPEPRGIARRARPSDELTERLVGSVSQSHHATWWWIIEAYQHSQTTGSDLKLRALVSEFHRAEAGSLSSGSSLCFDNARDHYDTELMVRDFLVYSNEKSIFNEEASLLTADRRKMLPASVRLCCYDAAHSTTAETVSTLSPFGQEGASLPAEKVGVHILTLQLSRVFLSENLDSILKAASAVVNSALEVDERSIEKIVWWHGRLPQKQYRPRTGVESQLLFDHRQATDAEAELAEAHTLFQSRGGVPHDPQLLMACKMFLGRREVAVEVRRYYRLCCELASSDLRKGMVELLRAFPDYARRSAQREALENSVRVLVAKIAAALTALRSTLLAVASERLDVFCRNLDEVAAAAKSAVATSRRDKYWKGES